MKKKLAQLVETQTWQLTEANRKLMLLSLNDALTGAANRRHFDQHLPTAIARSQDAGEPLSLLMIDLDHFKLLNDTLGHQKGDESLRRVSLLLKAAVPNESDLVARYGGEEYVIVLHNTAHAAALTFAQKINAAIYDAGIPNPSAPTDGRLTVSIGVATASPALPLNDRELLLAADSALYRAKREGRNRARSAQEADPPAESPYFAGAGTLLQIRS